MKLKAMHWKVTGRKSPKWIDLVWENTDGIEAIVDSPILDKRIFRITPDDITAALAESGLSHPDTAALLADLQTGKVEKPKPKRELYIAFHADMQNDPGPEEIQYELLTATSYDNAEQVLFRKLGKESKEFMYYSIFQAQRLVDLLTVEIAKSRSGRADGPRSKSKI